VEFKISSSFKELLKKSPFPETKIIKGTKHKIGKECHAK